MLPPPIMRSVLHLFTVTEKGLELRVIVDSLPEGPHHARGDVRVVRVLDLGQPEVRNLHDEMLGSSDKHKQRDLSSGRNACLKSLTLGSKL